MSRKPKREKPPPLPPPDAEPPARSAQLVQAFDFMCRAIAAQRAVDDILSPEQQAREVFSDGSYRVRCSSCNAPVSNPLPVPVIVAGYTVCVKCIEKGIEVHVYKQTPPTTEGSGGVH